MHTNNFKMLNFLNKFLRVYPDILCSHISFWGENILCDLCRKKKCPVNSHVGPSIFFTQAQKIFFSRKICANIECLGEHVNILS
jgi:hypothetical protein